jgi:hypothetical protein
MVVRSRRANAAVVFFVVSVLAACHGPSNAGTGFAPDGSRSRYAGNAAEPAATPTPPGYACPVPRQKVPGDYLLLQSLGTVSGTTYKAGTGGLSYWILMTFTKRVGPTPSADPTRPPNMKFLFYWGSYVMKNRHAGCFVLFTPLDGRPIFDTKYNGAAAGAPKFRHRSIPSTVLQEGFISSLVIEGLSEKGGAGKVTLLTSDRSFFTTGRIRLIGREVIDEAQAADIMQEMPRVP